MKRILVTCYEPIAVDPLHRQPWADVWIRFTAKPGRRRYEYAPTLLSRPELDVDLRDARDDSDAPDEVARLDRVAAILESRRIYVDPRYPDPSYPTVYAAAPWVDRREANTMLAVLMQVLGFRHAKFVWLRESFLVEPVSMERAPDEPTAAELAGAPGPAQPRSRHRSNAVAPAR